MKYSAKANIPSAGPSMRLNEWWGAAISVCLIASIASSPLPVPWIGKGNLGHTGRAELDILLDKEGSIWHQGRVAEPPCHSPWKSSAAHQHMASTVSCGQFSVLEVPLG